MQIQASAAPARVRAEYKDRCGRLCKAALAACTHRLGVPLMRLEEELPRAILHAAAHEWIRDGDDCAEFAHDPVEGRALLQHLGSLGLGLIFHRLS